MPHPGRGRPYPTHTRLGSLMDERGLMANTVAMQAGVHPRILSELLSGRKRPNPRHLAGLCSMLDVDPDDLLEDSYPMLPVEVPA